MLNNKSSLEKLVENSDQQTDVKTNTIEDFVAIKKSVQDKYNIPDEETTGTLLIFETKESVECSICENGGFEADDPIVDEIMSNIQQEIDGSTGDYMFQQISDLIAEEISKKKPAEEDK